LQFIAPDPVHVVVTSATPALHDTAGRMVAPKKRRTYAKFIRGAAPAWAVEIGRQAYEFRNMPPDIQVEQWLCHYDSIQDQAKMGWTDEEREAIEAKVIAQGYLRIEEPKLEAPYPGYDRFKGSAKDLARKLAEDGYDLAHAARYEVENQNRIDVLEELGDLMGHAEPVEEEAEVLA
jgi:hypothetical protein